MELSGANPRVGLDVELATGSTIKSGLLDNWKGPVSGSLLIAGGESYIKNLKSLHLSVWKDEGHIKDGIH